MIVDLNLKDKHAIVIGGGTEGVRKVNALLGQGCKITVISNRFNKYLRDQEKAGKIETVKATLKDASILDGYDSPFLVLASTDDRELNRKLCQKGREKGAFVYSVDDPPYSDFSYASVINIEGVMQVAISTSGKSPIMARQIRIRAERILRRVIKKSDIENAKLQEFARNAAKPKLKTVEQRKEFLYSILYDRRIQNLIKEDKIEGAKSATLELLQEWVKKSK
ncbi:precorrin-2 dehydrogenase/sirohydrochlorin ferrochelatase family protein [Nitrososphaera viennensis]|uniref:precorrin-2 dehydrogenase n=2 Tax=Nitrososphaera viennensis TaxID=1034015 RepID=A0A060HFV2_9ARCH|nr:bifunctional precorrin-2 dehydrogenase/sirohydrochlorin ferrochelatase [Nitrososphaera viennensis]AIC14255.1 putative siroheme synthase [Nitrososphaera viennensis EN76]UVS69251.1 bifunctional precorrin-2 dehydrogenase/sirohydrochlorin ferrochelatase [Nitrososphaera viennensis]